MDRRRMGDCIAVQINGNYVPIVPAITLYPTPSDEGQGHVYSEAN